MQRAAKGRSSRASARGGHPGSVLTALDDLADNFTSSSDQGPQAYAEQLVADHIELDLDYASLLTDAVTAVRAFHRAVTGAG
jgi:hypothetical protein